MMSAFPLTGGRSSILILHNKEKYSHSPAAGSKAVYQV
jgi:hypothetical protein